jgi:translocation and assembly module TamB
MRWLAAGLAALALLALAVAAGLGWLLGTQSGLDWAAAQVRGLEVEGLRGRLAGAVSAEKISYERDGVRVHAENVALRAHLAALLGGRLTIDPLRGETVSVEFQTRNQRQTSSKLPLRIHVAHAEVDTLSVNGTVFREVQLEHANLGATLSLAGSFYWPDERFATRARIDLRGTLERFEAHLTGTVAEIRAEARALIAPSSPQKLQSIEAQAGPVDIARFAAAAPRSALAIRLKGEGVAGGALSGTLSMDNSLPGALDAHRLPFTRLDAHFLTDFASARLRRMQVALHGGGSVEGDASLQAGRVEGRLVAARIDLRAIHSSLRRTALSGPFQFQVQGERQWARGSLTQEGMGLTAEVVRNGDSVEVRELRALAEGGEVSGTGKVNLGKGRRFEASLAVTRFDPSAFGDYPPGALSGSLAAAGTLEPRDIELEWSLGDSVLYEHSFQSDGAARILGERVTRADGDVRLGANRLTARGAYGRPADQLTVTLDAPRLEEFTPLSGSLRARGTLSGSLANPRASLTAESNALLLPGAVQLQDLKAKLQGTLAAHEAELTGTAPDLALDVSALLRGGWSTARGWSGEIRSLRNSGAYPLELVAPAALRVAPGRIELGPLETRIADGHLVLKETTWSPARLFSSGEFSRLPAQWLIVAGRWSERVSATMLVDGEWQLARSQTIEGFVRLRRVSGDVALGTTELGLERAAVDLRFKDGRAGAEASAASRVGQVTLAGELMPKLALQGKVAFAELAALTRPFLEEGRLDGRLSAELQASGTLASPRLHGTLSGEALEFELPLYGIALKDGTLKALLEGDSLKLEELALRGGEGRFTASGVLPLGLDGTARLQWRAQKLTLLERPDMRLVATGEGAASYDGKRVSLSGDLRADRGHFEFARDRLPSLGEDVVVLGDSRLRRTTPKARLQLPLTLDVRLDFGDELVVRGYGFDGKLSGLVDLATNKEGELRAYGRLQAVNATFLAYGQTLEVDPGVLIFDGPLDNPSLQITAWRRKQAVEAGVQVTGTMRAPTVQLVSQPPVPEGERLSWLVLGRPPSGATQADLGLLQAAAGALLAGGESVPLDRRIARRFGLDELSLRGSGELTDRVFAVGKRLSDRLYVSYEQGLGAVATNLLKLDYALGRRWTLRAETGSSSGGGLFYRYSWD